MTRTKIDRSSLITIGSACLILVTVVALAWRQSSWQTMVEYRLGSIEKGQSALTRKVESIDQNVKAVGEPRNAWHKPDMRNWAKEFDLSNDKQLVVPVPQNGFDGGR
jgi:hypothetical protein